MRLKPGVTPIMKVTNRCNLACTYCYDAGKEARDMPVSVMEKAILDIAEFNGRDRSTTFVWHGGEPLLMGLNFYRRALEVQEGMEGYQFHNRMQTNATLLTDEVADFLSDSQFKLGLSLDGPLEINNRTRVNHAGRGAFNKIYAGIQLARERGLASGAIVVVNRSNIRNLNEIYQFFRSEGLNLKINPLLKAGRASDDALSLDPVEYGMAMNNLFDLWFNDKDKINVDPFQAIIDGIVNGRVRDCTHSDNCQDGFISVDPLGDVYPCGRYSGMREFRLGNILADRIEDIDKAPYRQRIRERDIEECHSCRYEKLCHGGCPFEAQMSKGTVGEKSNYCFSDLIMFSHIENSIRRELDSAIVRERRISLPVIR